MVALTTLFDAVAEMEKPRVLTPYLINVSDHKYISFAASSWKE